jgi:hypothetical protein
MTGPDVPAADAAEQRTSAGGDEPRAQTPEVGLGADEADVLEQAQPVGPGEHRAARELPLEADAADSAEQAVVVPLDEDEGRDRA